VQSHKTTAWHDERSRRLHGEGPHRGGEKGGDDELVLEGVLNFGHHACGAQVGGDEGGQQADDDAGAGNEQRVAHGGVKVLLTQGGHRGDDQCCASGLREGAEQVSAHAGDVTHIVAHIVCKTPSVHTISEGKKSSNVRLSILDPGTTRK